MPQASPSHSLTTSRLVRFLRDLEVAEVELSHQHFTERLGRLVSFADSAALAELHGKLKTTSCKPTEYSDESIKALFLSVRKSIMEAIIGSFDPQSSTSLIRLPKPNPAETVPAYEPYLRFYMAHQREFEFRIKTLHTDIRNAVAGLSPALAQLAELDKSINDILFAHSRKFFTVVPGLLGKRFYYFFGENPFSGEHPTLQENSPYSTGNAVQAHQLNALSDQRLNKFCDELKGLLLAELDVRLLPTLGLIEAINEQVNKH